MQFSILTLKDILFHGGKVSLDRDTLSEMEKNYRFLENFSKDRVIYGIHTGFGPMAQWRVDDSLRQDLQYNIIRSHAAGAGEPLDDCYVKAAMIARLSTFAEARSGVYVGLPMLLTEFINRDIIPFVPRHGSVGASGDLVQLAHIALCLIGEGKVRFGGRWRDTAEVMAECGLQPMEIHIREGLAMTNGTSVMTAVAAINHVRASKLLETFVVTSVWINEICSSFDDMMAKELNEVRRHSGQQKIASRMREIACGSRCLRKREHELYDNGHSESKVFDHKVQPFYSLRCIPQILGPILETIENAGKIIDEELNSATDNPIVDHIHGNVYHGGNFHGDYISLEEDKVKIAVTRIAMTAERQLNYLCNDKINGILPPFVNMGRPGIDYGIQACQFTATSTTAECQTLSMPNYVHSIPNNNDNQDIVSMGTNSALICSTVIENCYEVMAILCIAMAQATDCLGIAEKLAPTTRKLYEDIREIVPAFVKDKPFYDRIEKVRQFLTKI